MDNEDWEASMIKLPEPLLIVTEKLSSIIPAGTRIHTEQSLKQAVRDAYEDAAKTCDAYAELCEREQGQTTLYGHIRASAAQVLAKELRALIKEIPE
jgi:hypothetical protein